MRLSVPEPVVIRASLTLALPAAGVGAATASVIGSGGGAVAAVTAQGLTRGIRILIVAVGRRRWIFFLERVDGARVRRRGGAVHNINGGRVCSCF